ncbi:MAG: histidine phosphotransferase family protein [Roseovarius sp.]
MPHHTQALGALIASRICHDLVSPLGAVGNGLELLGLSGSAEGPEMALVTASAAQALARVRLFRLAFGQAEAEQVTRAEELRDILGTLHEGGRIALSLHITGPLPRPTAQILLLGLLCVEQALPQGGQISLNQTPEDWQIVATAPRLAPQPDLWQALCTGAPWPKVSPAQVHFLILHQCLAAQSLALQHMLTDTEFRVTL